MNMSMRKRDGVMGRGVGMGDLADGGLGVLHFPYYRHVVALMGTKWLQAAAASSLSLSAKQDNVSDASKSSETATNSTQ